MGLARRIILQKSLAHLQQIPKATKDPNPKELGLCFETILLEKQKLLEHQQPKGRKAQQAQTKLAEK